MLSRPSEPEEQGAKGAKSVWVAFSRFESAEQFLGESTPRVTLELAAIPDAPARHRLPYPRVGRPWSAVCESHQRSPLHPGSSDFFRSWF